jgi:hypothetical protein
MCSPCDDVQIVRQSDPIGKDFPQAEHRLNSRAGLPIADCITSVSGVFLLIAGRSPLMIEIAHARSIFTGTLILQRFMMSPASMMMAESGIPAPH